MHTTGHFRVLWGDGYDSQLPRWQDPDGDGVPSWVEVLGQALEDAYSIQTGLGFPEPYGVDSCGIDPLGGCYVDAYVGNTGLVVDGQNVAIGSSFYAFTEIDTEYRVAYFVFNFQVIETPGVLRATAAHELFHAVQRTMGYPWDAEGPWDGEAYISAARWDTEAWLLEASATWLEEVTFPEVDDYIAYVNGFLAQPHVALNSLDGLHEYGAAVFAGYIWRLYGGAHLLRAVYENAYGLEVEPALRAALSDRGAGALEDVLAGFWARAAEPSTVFWPDADQFVPAAPLATVTSVPATVYPTSRTRPGRFGANVIRLAADTLPAAVGMEWTDPAQWRLAAQPESGTGVGIATPEQALLVEIGATDDAGYATLAVVNVSPGDGAKPYAVEIGGDGAIDATVQWRESAELPPVATGGSGGDGGCFLRTLGR
ncbi:MAG: hypothetical protein P1P84_12690 [Deferrisomatales bacterium]|nr:hypothetical protein [Deferrisomatales bacterium]